MSIYGRSANAATSAFRILQAGQDGHSIRGQRIASPRGHDQHRMELLDTSPGIARVRSPTSFQNHSLSDAHVLSSASANREQMLPIVEISMKHHTSLDEANPERLKGSPG